LLVLDKATIAENPGVKFLHFSRQCGTWLHLMHPADSSVFPAKGRRVPFLFGTAEREQILDGERLCVQSSCRSGSTLLILYYDGKKLRSIDGQRAKQLWAAYHADVMRQWSKEGISETAGYRLEY
jgi:hypothetical protein